MEGTSSDSDRMFLLSLLPAMKELSPLDNMDFRFEVQLPLQQKLRRPAAPELQLITYQSTSWASPSALSDYSSNNQINCFDCTLTSEGCPRNATDPGTVVTQTVSTAQPARAPKAHQFKQLWKEHQWTWIHFTSYKTYRSKKKNRKTVLSFYWIPF